MANVGGLPMLMKYLSAFAATVWNGTIVLFWGAARIVFAGVVAYGVYLVVQQFGFSEKAAFASAAFAWLSCWPAFSWAQGRRRHQVQGNDRKGRERPLADPLRQGRRMPATDTDRIPRTALMEKDEQTFKWLRKSRAAQRIQEKDDTKVNLHPPHPTVN